MKIKQFFFMIIDRLRTQRDGAREREHHTVKVSDTLVIVEDSCKKYMKNSTFSHTTTKIHTYTTRNNYIKKIKHYNYIDLS